MERPQTRRGSSQAGARQRDRPESAAEADYIVHRSPSPMHSTQMSLSARVSSSIRPSTSGFSAGDLADSAGTGPRISGASRPRSRTGTATPGLMSANLHRVLTAHAHSAAVERPTTQQGLGGLKSAFRGPQRQIQDKSYFQGILRTKMTEISAEMAKLKSAIEKNRKEQQNLPTIENKVKELAAEITDLQGQAADLNLLQERITTSSDPSQMDYDIQSFLVNNEKEAFEAEQIFYDVKSLREKVASLERDIQLEQENSEKLLLNLPAKEQEKYANLKLEHDRLVKDVESETQRMNELENRYSKLGQDLQQSPVKKDIFEHKKMTIELENQLQSMLEQDSKHLDPEAERTQLVAAVRRDNTEVSAMEQQIKETSFQIEHIQNQLKEVENSLNDSQSERGQKYRDLKKREQVMDEFLASWEDNCQEEKSRLTQLENQIMQAVTKLGKQQSLINLVPSIADYTTAKEDLLLKESELEKSRTTLEGIALEYQRLQTNLQKLENLEVKIRDELATLKDQLASIQINSTRFANIDEFKQEAEIKRNQLIMQQQDLQEKKTELQTQVNELQEEYDQLQAELAGDETHQTLSTLDEKLRLIEEDNEAMNTFIEDHKKTLNVSELRHSTMETVSNYLSGLLSAA